MSRPTDGFSAMTSVLLMAGHVSEGIPGSSSGRCGYSRRVADVPRRRRAEPAGRPVPVPPAGEVVVMFPEGTRQRKGLRKRWEARPHTGAARIAQRAGAPLVPAAIKGTDRLARLGPLRVAYGPPVEVTEDSHETTDRLMAEIRRLHETL